MRLTFAILAVFCSVSGVYAQATVDRVTITSSSVGAECLTGFQNGASLTMAPTSLYASAEAFWFARVNGSCETGLTSQDGTRVAPGQTYEFTKDDQRWDRICCIRESGSGSLIIRRNRW